MIRNCNAKNPWIMQRADPYVYRHSDGTYYFTASVPAYDSIVLRKSHSLNGLSTSAETVIWKKHASGPMSAHIWAPEPHYLENKWYIYFAAGNAESPWHIRPYILECADEDPLTGTWVEKGMIQPAEGDDFSFQAFSLDATILENKGKYYYIWAEKVGVGKQISNLYISGMASPTRLETVQVLLTTPDYDWERYGYWVNEGPAILKKNGKIYLTYSASDTGIHYFPLTKTTIFWIRKTGTRNACLFLLLTRLLVFTAPVIIALRLTKMGIPLWSSTQEQKQKLREILFTIPIVTQ